MTIKTIRVAVAFAAAAAFASAPQAAPQASAYRPAGTHTELGLAAYAKILCSAVFVSGRDPDEAAKNSAYWFMPRGEAEKVDWKVDRAERLARASFGGITREARYYGDQGCIIQQPGKGGIYFTPVPVRTTLPDAMSQPWPMGDRPDAAPLAPGIERAKLDAAVEAAFADPAGLTAAFVVVHKGRIVAERYMPGITRDTQLESWSMGKSIAATLFALLVKDGTYTLDQPALVPEWRGPGDPRGKIRPMDLLRMSSGLRFIATQDPDYAPDKGYPDHFYVYTGAVNAFEYSVHQPLQFQPNTEGRYRNCDPLTLMHLAKLAVTRRGESFLTWPQRALFDRIGIRRQVLETDPYGNFLITGYDYGTARNWARLGLLYCNDGIWPAAPRASAPGGRVNGERILPEGWTRFVSAPAPAWKEPVYGGLFWTNLTGRLNLPRDAYHMAGAGGQHTIIVPSLRLVVVRMGHQRGGPAGFRALNTALGLLVEAIPKS